MIVPTSTSNKKWRCVYQLFVTKVTVLKHLNPMATNILPFKRLFYRQNDKIGSRYQQQNIDPEGSGFLKNQNFTHLVSRYQRPWNFFCHKWCAGEDMLRIDTLSSSYLASKCSCKFFKWANPGLFVYFLYFQIQLPQKIAIIGQDSKSNCLSRRQAHWPPSWPM